MRPRKPSWPSSIGRPASSGMALDTPYNYRAFSWDCETNELGRWLAAGPRTGAVAPDFELVDLDGNVVRLRDLRGRAVVIEFGSYTCPIFSDRVPHMERLAREYTTATF